MKNNNKIIIIFILILLNLNSEDSFSNFEYGKMLYSNPRGISCILCHGKKGRGVKSIISFYESSKNNKVKNIVINGGKILKLSLKNFMTRLIFNKMLNRDKIDIMPNYYLTEKEIKLIYNFLHSKNNS